MSLKTIAAKSTVKNARKAPGKGKAAKTGLKLGKRKVARTPAGTAVLYSQALVGNDEARAELREALDSARKAYARSADRRGRPDLGMLFEDRKARRDAGNAAAAFRRAIKTAARKRKKAPRKKGPAVTIAIVAGAGTAAGIAKYQRAKAAEGTDPSAGAVATPAPPVAPAATDTPGTA